MLPHKLVPGGVLPESATIDTKLVVISHDCDLVNSSFEAEPFLEVFLARPKKTKTETASSSTGGILGRSNFLRKREERSDSTR